VSSSITNGASISGTVDWQIATTGSVDHVNFWVGGAKVATATGSSPYHYSLNTTAYPNGNLVVAAELVSAAGSGSSYGNTTQGASTVTSQAKVVRLSKVTVPQSVTIAEIHAWLGSNGGAGGPVRPLIYAADGASGTPLTLVYAGPEFTVGAASAMADRTLVSGLTLTLAAGDYWVGGWNGNVTDINWAYDNVAGAEWENSQLAYSSSGTPVSPFSTSNGASNFYKHSVYLKTASSSGAQLMQSIGTAVVNNAVPVVLPPPVTPPPPLPPPASDQTSALALADRVARLEAILSADFSLDLTETARQIRWSPPGLSNTNTGGS
jgi:hypothetical protein